LFQTWQSSFSISIYAPMGRQPFTPFLNRH